MGPYSMEYEYIWVYHVGINPMYVYTTNTMVIQSTNTHLFPLTPRRRRDHRMSDHRSQITLAPEPTMDAISRV
jgi:hypothetical protein